MIGGWRIRQHSFLIANCMQIARWTRNFFFFTNYNSSNISSTNSSVYFNLTQAPSLQSFTTTRNYSKMSETFSLYRVRTSGIASTLSHRVYLENENGKLISFFHDVPTFVNGEQGEKDGLVHMICEIPKWSNAKLEVPFKRFLVNHINLYLCFLYRLPLASLLILSNKMRKKASLDLSRTCFLAKDILGIMALFPRYFLNILTSNIIFY